MTSATFLSIHYPILFIQIICWLRQESPLSTRLKKPTTYWGSILTMQKSSSCSRFPPGLWNTEALCVAINQEMEVHLWNSWNRRPLTTTCSHLIPLLLWHISICLNIPLKTVPSPSAEILRLRHELIKISTYKDPKPVGNILYRTSLVLCSLLTPKEAQTNLLTTTGRHLDEEQDEILNTKSSLHVTHRLHPTLGQIPGNNIPHSDTSNPATAASKPWYWLKYGWFYFIFSLCQIMKHTKLQKKYWKSDVTFFAIFPSS